MSLHNKTLKGWIDTVVIVVKEKRSIVVDKTISIEEVENVSLHPSEPRQQTNLTHVSIVISHAYSDSWVKSNCILMSSQRAIFSCLGGIVSF